MLDQKILKEHLSYDPDTGVFKRIKSLNNKVRIGDVAGGLDAKGYVCLRLLGEMQKAHRLAWLYVYGSLPTGEIDHINHNPSDNRIDNLRDVSKAVNQQNQKNPHGVQKDRGRFIAIIRANGERFYLGCFGSKEEAQTTYISAKALLHTEARK